MFIISTNIFFLARSMLIKNFSTNFIKTIGVFYKGFHVFTFKENFSQRIYKVCIMIIRKIPVANNSRWKFSKVHFKYRYSQPMKSDNPVPITHVVWKDFGLLVSIKSIELDFSGFFKASRLFYKVCEIIRFTKRFHGSLFNSCIKISKKDNAFIFTVTCI